MTGRIWPFLLAGALLGTVACGGRAGREEAAGAARAAAATAPPVTVDWAAVERAMGRPGSMQPGEVEKFGLPRSDLTVTIGRIQLKPALALGSWVAFKATSAGAVVMGDLVLRDDEIEPVMAKLAEGGVEVTALHHHVLHETPRVFYMHIHGVGNAVTLAQTLRAAVGLTKTPPPPVATTAVLASPLGLDTARIAKTLGHSGKVNGGVYQVSVPRRDTIRDGDVVIPPAMGVATALNFQPTGGGKAAITGDFVLRAAEVTLVLRALRAHGIDVTAVHSHMLDEQPRLYFMHFWAVGDAGELATGLRSALDSMGGAGPRP
jgi:hypothetical protein